MADPTTNTATDPAEDAKPADQAPQANSELNEQLTALGNNINALLKTMWDNEQRKTVEHQITSGLEQMNKQISKAIDQVTTDTHVKKAREGIKGAWVTAHGPQILTELKGGLADTLKALNQELSKASAPKPAVEVKPADEAAPPAGETKPPEA